MNLKLEFLRKTVVCLACASAIGCVEVKEDVKAEVPKLVKGPEEAPFRTITNFTHALRCMDTLMIDYGIYDVSMLVEDIRDTTDKVKAGAKDMLISAVSEMTRRSHAIRLIAFGSDSGNLVSFLASANETSPYAVVPQYDIRGSISQLDKSIAAKDASAGINIEKVGIGGAKTANASVLALDLAVMSTRDYSVIPGVVSKNTIVIFKEGKGLDADATIGKFGVNFSMNLTRSEGDAQALRNLVELASVELIGKLTKTPYWRCLGIDPQHVEIQNEIYDWYYNLAADQQIVAYFQTQLANRGYYRGALDGQYNAELTDAVNIYQRALGMEADGNIDRDLFDALLNQPVPPKPRAPQQTVPAAVAEAADVDIRFLGGSGDDLRPGQTYRLAVAPTRDAYVFCYFEADDGSVQRFFPNRFVQDSLVRRAEPLQIPGSMPFKLYASRQGSTERLACFTSPRPLMQRLPASVKGTDFEKLPVRSLGDVQTAFENLVGSDLGGKYLEIKVQ
jgi:hypothetical protein